MSNKKNLNLFPPTVDFMLLGSCNLRCSFCFGPKHEIPPMDTDKAIKIIKKLAEGGVKNIIFTGGEPTLIKDLPKILSVTKNLGLNTILSTNGIILAKNDKLLKEIVSKLNWIALPLEGDTPTTESKMRPGPGLNLVKDHFLAIIELIKKIRNEFPHVKIKLGTVVSRPNIKHVIGIPKVLKENKAIPDVWKLYQVSPSEYGKVNYEILKVEDAEFEKIHKKIKQLANQLGINRVVKYTNKERPKKYFFINPKGEVLIIHPKNNDYYSLGNFIKDFDNVIKRWKKYIDLDLLNCNYNSTYPSIS